MLCDGPLACSVQWLQCLSKLCGQTLVLCTFTLEEFPLLSIRVTMPCHNTINEMQTSFFLIAVNNAVHTLTVIILACCVE